MNFVTQIHKEVATGNEQVLQEVRRITGNKRFNASSPEAICNEILTTCYMASENSSSKLHRALFIVFFVLENM